jgi:hypothetical protein
MKAMKVQFPSIRVCQYCDKEIRGEAWVSFTEGFTATLCSHQCKTLYEKATSNQGVLPFRWDVT